MNILKEVITSRQNQTLIWASSLSEKKYRDEFLCFSADGFKLFREAVLASSEITHVFIMESKKEQYLPSVIELLSNDFYKNTLVMIVKDVCFDKLTKEKAPQGIVTIVKYLDKIKNNIKIYKVDDYNYNNEKIIILSSLRDPSNIGAILRSASAFGVTTVIASIDCADVYQHKTVRAAMGALFRTQILFCENLPEMICSLRASGRRVVAAELREGAVSLNESGFCGRDIVVIGNEGHGIGDDVSAACDMSVYLPISSTTESLNAAVAASIFLWEMRDR